MLPDTISIIPASRQHAEALGTFSTRCFTEKFGHLYAKQDINSFLQDYHSAYAYQRYLEDKEQEIFLLMEHQTIIGYVMIGANNLPIISACPTAGEIKRLYISSDFQSKGLGALLLEYGIKTLEQERKAKEIYLGVYSENEAAQRFYARYGFKYHSNYVFLVGKHEDKEYILKRGGY